MHWAAQSIGLPYVLGGRDMQGCDCWGLVLMVLRNDAGIEMQDVAVGETGNDASIRDNFKGWSKIPLDGELQPFDVITMRGINGNHIGIIAKGDERLMLHSETPASCIIPVKFLPVAGYKHFRAWRYRGN